VRVVDCGPEHSQLPPYCTDGAVALLSIASACDRGHVGNAVSLEEVCERQHRQGDALWRYDFWSPVLLIILQHIGYEDLSGITWAGAASSALQPLREKDFSLFAVRRAS
jgi:hypothetical protein